MGSTATPQRASQSNGSRSLLDRIVSAGESAANVYAAQQLAKTATKSTKSVAPYVLAGAGILTVGVVAVMYFRRK